MKPSIMVAPNGARRTRDDHPALPLSTSEIVQCARNCAAVGADALHLHVREDDGTHSLDPGRYRDTLAALGESVPDMAIQITTEAAERYNPAEQFACLRALRPSWASVSVREIARDPRIAERLYRDAHDNSTRLEHIVYDRGDLIQLARWRDAGTLPDPAPEILLVLGAYQPPRPASPTALGACLAAMNRHFAPLRWRVCAFGPAEHACLLAAARAGGHVRVGFENSTGDGARTWADNAASVAALIAQLGQTLYTPTRESAG